MLSQIEFEIIKYKVIENILFEIYAELADGEVIDEAKINKKLINILNECSPVSVEASLSWFSWLKKVLGIIPKKR